MTRRYVRIVSGGSIGGPALVQGSRVVLPDGSEVPGVQSIVLEATAGDGLWRATIICTVEPFTLDAATDANPSD